MWLVPDISARKKHDEMDITAIRRWERESRIIIDHAVQCSAVGDLGNQMNLQAVQSYNVSINQVLRFNDSSDGYNEKKATLDQVV